VIELLVASAVFGDRNFRLQAGNVGESAEGVTGSDSHDEIECCIGCSPRHFLLPPLLYFHG